MNLPQPPNQQRPLRVLVLGATGYIGGRLVPRLLAEGHQVRCLARRPEALEARPWGRDIDIVPGDLAEPDQGGDHCTTIAPAFADIDVVFHLVHSMTDGEDFSQKDRAIANNVREAAAKAGVAQIVYLGGLGDDNEDQSTHLASRHEVGRILAMGPTPVTELRAAIVLGSGSASFEMLRSLVEILPIMVVPRWVQRTRCQPVAIGDVIDALARVCGDPATYRRVLDLGGPDVLTYREMMDGYAEVAGLHKRLILPVPVLTPGLSSWWVNLVTPLPLQLAKALVSSLASDVVVRPGQALARADGAERLGYREALRRALEAEGPGVVTRWSDAALAWRPEIPQPEDPSWAGATRYVDERLRTSSAPAPDVFAVISALGGRTGWYGTDWLWEIRGLMDKAVGGFGLRRGRRNPTSLRLGDAVDWWRVAAIEPNERLVLQAEMRLPGKAWLSWELEQVDRLNCRVIQRAIYLPRGIVGRLYWYAVFPFHGLIFPRLLRRVCEAAESEASPA